MTSQPTTHAATPENTMSLARAYVVANMQDFDGQTWKTHDGRDWIETLEALADSIDRDEDRVIYTFDDGSEIMTCESYWDILDADRRDGGGVEWEVLEVAEPVITAEVTARGADSNCPDHEDAVDATIYADGEEVGEVTLLVDDYTGELVSWGSLDNWASYQLQKWLSGDEERMDEVVGAVRAAVSAATVLHASVWSDGWAVTDTAGGTWWPDAAAKAEIEASANPAATAERIAAEEPMRGTWHQ